MPADPLLARQRAFAGVLARGMTTPGADRLSPQDKARQTAEQLVAVAFLQPLLKQLRESSHAAPPFAPTQAEKQFGALSDAELAQQLTHAAHFPLVDRLARDLLRRTSMESAEEALTDGRAALAPDPARTMTPAFSLRE
jgi:Rod binding domain-containing protein